MQRSIVPYIKHSFKNNNFSSLTKKLQLSTGILGVFFILELINQMEKTEGGGYK